MQTMTELQAEADRRSAELTRAAQSKAEERAKIYEEINRRDAEMKAQKEEAIQQSEKQARAERAKFQQQEQDALSQFHQQEYERRCKQAEYAVSFEGQVLSTLQAVAQATQSTADSVRQIRNFIAALLVFGLVAGILLVIAISRV